MLIRCRTRKTGIFRDARRGGWRAISTGGGPAVSGAGWWEQPRGGSQLQRVGADRMLRAAVGCTVRFWRAARVRRRRAGPAEGRCCTSSSPEQPLGSIIYQHVIHVNHEG